MTTKYHQYRGFDNDGSIAVRVEPGDKWTVIEGDQNSGAADFAKQQNRFWKSWTKESIQNHRGD